MIKSCCLFQGSDSWQNFKSNGYIVWGAKLSWPNVLAVFHPSVDELCGNVQIFMPSKDQFLETLFAILLKGSRQRSETNDFEAHAPNRFGPQLFFYCKNLILQNSCKTATWKTGSWAAGGQKHVAFVAAIFGKFAFEPFDIFFREGGLQTNTIIGPCSCLYSVPWFFLRWRLFLFWGLPDIPLQCTGRCLTFSWIFAYPC